MIAVHLDYPNTKSFNISVISKPFQTRMKDEDENEDVLYHILKTGNMADSILYPDNTNCTRKKIIIYGQYRIAKRILPVGNTSHRLTGKGPQHLEQLKMIFCLHFS